jgi:RNA polymerase subunit RPABC4/transcription elongation factor Spt4
MTLNPLGFSNFVSLSTAFAAAFLAALWLSLIIWTYRDAKSRTRDPLARLLAALVVALLFLPGLLIYRILRSPNTLENDYQHTLEEEALLQTIEDAPLCPGCGRKIDPDWFACPSCHTRLKKACHQCGRLMDLSWNLCPWCATPVPGMQQEHLSLEDALDNLPPIETEGEGETPTSEKLPPLPLFREVETTESSSTASPTKED